MSLPKLPPLEKIPYFKDPLPSNDAACQSTWPSNPSCQPSCQALPANQPSLPAHCAKQPHLPICDTATLVTMIGVAYIVRDQGSPYPPAQGV